MPSNPVRPARRAVDPHRRAFSALLLAAPAVLIPGRRSRAAAHPLRFYHTHTGESLEVVHREHGDYLSDALAELNRFLRDFRTGEEHPIDPRLFDILVTLQGRTGSRRPFEVISAFRSAATNALLRGAGANSGVARKSLHMTGNAIDVRLRGVATRELRRAAVALGRGGVGYYPKSDFVHLDTGRVRNW